MSIRRCYFLMSALTILSACLSVAAWATDNFSPQGLTLQGTILNAAGQPEEAASVSFMIQIMSPSASGCLLYSETQTLNMSNSSGAFALTIGAGARAGVGFQATSTLAQVFSNSSGIINSLTCTTGASYTPASNDSRNVVVTFNDGSGPQTFSQALAVESAPYSLFADQATTLQGLNPTNFIQTNTTTTQAAVDALTSNSKFMTFASGTNFSFVPQSSNGTETVPATSGAPAGLTAGQFWYDPTNNVLKYYNGTATETVTSLSGVLPIASGGTDNGSLAVTNGGILYTDGTEFQNSGAGVSGEPLISGGAGAPTWSTVSLAGGNITMPASGNITNASGAMTVSATTNLNLQPAGGNVGIGTTAPSATLQITSPSASTGLMVTQTNANDLSTTMISNTLTVNPASQSSGDGNTVMSNTLTTPVGSSGGSSYTGLQNSLAVADTSAANVIGESTSATGRAGSITGSIVIAQMHNNGAAVALDGVSTTVNTGTGTLSSATGLGVSMTTGATTITNMYGLNIGNTNTGATISNNYGIYIGALSTASTQYSIYASDANSPSYFADNIGIGTTAPGAPLDVNQTTAGSTALNGQNAGTAFWKVLNPAGGISAGYNAANAVEYVAKDTGTGRSINAAGTINASGADFAEWIDWPSADKPQMGSVILFKGSYVVVSSPFTAAFVGNDTKNPNTSILVAFAGQLPVLVQGTVNEGDLIIANDDGTGTAVSKDQVTLEMAKRAVGTAWEASSDSSLKRVNVAVGIGIGSGAQRDIASLKANDSAKDQEIQKLKQENSLIKAYSHAREPLLFHTELSEVHVSKFSDVPTSCAFLFSQPQTNVLPEMEHKLHVPA
jgi:hypothetical protein